MATLMDFSADKELILSLSFVVWTCVQLHNGYFGGFFC